MNWIKQNQLLAGIAAVAIMGTLALLWLASTKMSATTKAVTSYRNSANEMSRLYGENIYPSQENLAKKQEQVAQLKTEVGNLRAGLAKSYGAQNGGDPATFGQRVQENFNGTKAALDAGNIQYPETFFLGFDSYRQGVAASPAAIRELDYQLNAITALIKFAAASGISGIDRFTRGPVIGEAGGPDAKTGSGPLRRYSMDIHLTGSENSVRSFVNAIAASNQYFYAFRAIRLMNEVQTGPKKEDVRREVKAPDTPAAVGGAADIFAQFAAEAGPALPVEPGEGGILPGDQPAAPVPSKFVFGKPGAKDAYQFLGAEKVKAAIRLYLVIFQPAPEAKADAEETN